MNTIENILNDRIVEELEDLKDMELGTEQHKAAVDSITKLIDRAIEFDKLNSTDEERSEKREDAKAAAEFERDLKLKQFDLDSKKRDDAIKSTAFEQKTKLTLMEEERTDRFVRNCIGVAGIVVPTVITIWGTLKSFEFEKEGTITTSVGRGFIGRLIPKK